MLIKSCLNNRVPVGETYVGQPLIAISLLNCYRTEMATNFSTSMIYWIGHALLIDISLSEWKSFICNDMLYVFFHEMKAFIYELWGRNLKSSEQWIAAIAYT